MHAAKEEMLTVGGHEGSTFHHYPRIPNHCVFCGMDRPNISSEPANRVLICTGACGVGKSTTTRAWAKKHHGAIIDCDFFTEWIYDPEFPHWQPEEETFVASLTAKVARHYLDAGMPVAIDNVWHAAGLEKLETLLRKQRPNLRVTMIHLQCTLPENQRRDHERVPGDRMNERVAIVRKELDEEAWPPQVRTIDTTHLSVSELIAVIDEE